MYQVEAGDLDPLHLFPLLLGRVRGYQQRLLPHGPCSALWFLLARRCEEARHGGFCTVSQPVLLGSGEAQVLVVADWTFRFAGGETARVADESARFAEDITIVVSVLVCIAGDVARSVGEVVQRAVWRREGARRKFAATTRR